MPGIILPRPRIRLPFDVCFGAIVVAEIDASREQTAVNSLGMLICHGRF